MKRSDLDRLPPIRTLMTMPCAPVGVGMTSRSLLHAASIAGVRIDLTTSRYDGRGGEAFAIHEPGVRLARFLPHRIGKWLGEMQLHRRYISAFEPGDIAYLWPSVPLAVHEDLAGRGIRIVTEAINTRMAVAKPILDAAYESLGLPPAHGITDARIREQEDRYALAAAIFAPSPATEAALAGSAFRGLTLPTSYGTWVPPRLPAPANRKVGRPVTFLFVGSVGVRKGAHILLEAWKTAPANARLRLVGPVEQPIRKLFGDVLNRDSVTCTGFLSDVGPEYRAADVFVLPSLEEGDPIVTYEAAAHRLPIIASPIGAGRIGADTGSVQLLTSGRTEELADQIRHFSRSEDLRQDWADRARAAALAYDWIPVAERRFSLLAGALDQLR